MTAPMMTTEKMLFNQDSAEMNPATSVFYGFRTLNI